jgi:hypothetical protein
LKNLKAGGIMRPKKCTSPGCKDTPLVKSEIESSLSVERWECPRCGKPYNCPTTLASTAQVATAASALSIVGTFALHLLTEDWDSAIEHAADNLDEFFG